MVTAHWRAAGHRLGHNIWKSFTERRRDQDVERGHDDRNVAAFAEQNASVRDAVLTEQAHKLMIAMIETGAAEQEASVRMTPRDCLRGTREPGEVLDLVVARNHAASKRSPGRRRTQVRGEALSLLRRQVQRLAGRRHC